MHSNIVHAEQNIVVCRFLYGHGQALLILRLGQTIRQPAKRKCIEKEVYIFSFAPGIWFLSEPSCTKFLVHRARPAYNGNP